MLIQNQEALKSWLVIVLEPLCDADSSALARYVLALLKKDKPENELKRLMIEQLDVFLAEETKSFVERLFDAINLGEYFTTLLLPAVHSPKAPAIASGGAREISNITHNVVNNTVTSSQLSDALTNSVYSEKNQALPIDENKTKDEQNNTHHVNDVLEQSANYPSGNKFEGSSVITVSSHLCGATGHVRSASPLLRMNADKENQPRERRRRRASLLSRSRSRSRSCSNERLSRRSRSRDRRINEREKMQRQFRNKSPPCSELRHAPHDRRRCGIFAGSDRRRTGGSGNIVTLDERSPRFCGSSGEGGGRKQRANRSKSRSRSSSVERASRNKLSPGVSRNTRSPIRHTHTHGQLENEKRQRCRDFDEKGYCVRGETCPWDHGINPVVFEDINNSALIGMSLPEYNPDAPDLWMRSATIASVGVSTSSLMAGATSGIGSIGNASINPFTGVARAGRVISGTGVPGTVGFSHIGSSVDKSAGSITNDYARVTPAAFRTGAPMIPFPFNPAVVTTPLQRELIPIPVVDAGSDSTGGDISQIQQSKRRYELEDSVAVADGPAKRKLPLNSRLGPRIPVIQNNCSLELRKIPRGLNTIAHLNNHFAKFGKIVNIQISYEGDPEAAIITFSTHAEANVAYRSTEAVLNNRFIKVFWHNQDGGSLIVDAVSTIIGCNRKSSQYHLNNIPAMPTPSADSAKIVNTIVVNHNIASSTVNKTSSTPDASNTVNTTIVATHIPSPSLRLKNTTRSLPPTTSNAIIRKKQEEQAKAVVQLANGLRKRKQELLQSYVKQMKSALELVERCEPNDSQRNKTLDTIKVLQETIDKLRKEIAAEQEQMQTQILNQHPLLPKKSKEQQKKELLDIELELIAQQQEGNDISAIQKRLEELQRSLGIVPGSGATSSVSMHSSPVIGKVTHYSAGRSNPRSRLAYTEGFTRVDRRPKTIVVTGFTGQEADFVLGHFKHFGEITKHNMDKNIPQLILSYDTRINAEQAVLRGKIFKDKRLQITWAPVIQPTSALSVALHTENKSLQSDSKSDDMVPTITAVAALNNSENPTCNDIEITGDTLPELRLEDEEEEDESEDRSWRR